MGDSGGRLGLMESGLLLNKLDCSIGNLDHCVIIQVGVYDLSRIGQIQILHIGPHLRNMIRVTYNWHGLYEPLPEKEPRRNVSLPNVWDDSLQSFIKGLP